MKEYKMIILEGLPGVGKSTITKSINKFDPKIVTVDEIIYDKIFANVNLYQEMYFYNDDMKIEKAVKAKKSVVDRGPISTLSYNQVRCILDKNFDYNLKDTYKWFEKFENVLDSNDVCVIYLTTEGESYYIPYDNSLDPYGSQVNQELLEKVAMTNCKKYCKNLVVFKFKKENMEGLIDEIINKYLCS